MKFLFMIMIVYIHSYALPEMPFDIYVPEYVTACKNIVTEGICDIAVPAFFLISGFLLFSREFTWFGNIKKKCKSIVVPYLIINTYWIVFFKGMQAVPAAAPLFSGAGYQINGLEGIMKAYLGMVPLYYPFWFLRDLFIVNIFAGVIKIMLERVPLLAVVLALAIELHVVRIPFTMSGSAFSMFILGAYLADKRNLMDRADRFPVMCAGFAYIAAILIKLQYSNYVNGIMLIYVITGLLFWYKISGLIITSKASNRLLAFAKYSFFIYAFHEFYEAMFKKAIMFVFPQTGPVLLIEFFTIPCIITGVCIIFGKIINKKCPTLYKIICGSRQ